MSGGALSVEREDVGPGAMLRVAGELDLNTHQQLREAIGALSVSGSRLVIDLGEVTFMDSSGIGAIGIAQQAVGSGTLVLVVQSTHIRKLLKIAGLDRSAQVHASVAEALDALPPTS